MSTAGGGATTLTVNNVILKPDPVCSRLTALSIACGVLHEFRTFCLLTFFCGTSYSRSEVCFRSDIHSIGLQLSLFVGVCLYGQVTTGANFTLLLECTSDDSITAGTFVTQVYLAGIPVTCVYVGVLHVRLHICCHKSLFSPWR